ncbi:23S rRNA (guanosine(2251)-2'-O)-methyltransferase RlmB [candidate division WWE3 bacterium]|nr:23S rRNA (guanosine(2251)-2'-O)-methyltransferase RlmB [candidate division WWE3 bacterium]
MREHAMNASNLEGRNVVIEALKRKRKIFEILVDDGARGEKIRELINFARKENVKVTTADRTSLDALSKTDAHQGVIALAEPIATHSLSAVLKKDRSPFVVILREVLYEHNLGAVLRTAAAANVSAVVVPSAKGNVVSPVVERVSMGASNVVKVCTESVYSALAVLKKYDVKTVGVEVGGQKYYFEENLKGPIAFVLGGEDSSLSLPVKEKCDIVVRVPMGNDIQSLNLSVAAGIIMFEKVRQEFAARK